MTFAAEKDKYGKTVVVVAEIYASSCSLTYGVAPCLAVGTPKCFNTLSTCRSRPSFTSGTKMYRFSSARVEGLQQTGDAPTFPTIASVDTAPTVLTPGQGFGIRSSVKITLQDHPWTDAGVDPYLNDRSGSQDMRGTFWGRWIARNPYYEGRRVDLLTGFMPDDGVYDATNFKRRTYILVRVSGPDENGRVILECKDPLKYADTAKARYPIATTSVLLAAMNSSQTTLVVQTPDATLWPTPPEYIRIDNEVMHVVGSSYNGGTLQLTLTIVRANYPAIYDPVENVAKDHKVGVTVQACVWLNNVPVADIVYTLLKDVAGIDMSYLPKSEWDAEMANGFSAYAFSTLLTQPIGVKDLLQEISEHNILLWWDERAQKVRMRGLILRGPLNTVAYDDYSNIIAGSTDVADDYKSRVTQVWVYHGFRSPLLELKKPQNHSQILVRADLDAESPDQYDGSTVKAIYSRWMAIGAPVAGEIASRYLINYRQTRKVLTFTVDAKDDLQWTGDVVRVKTGIVQDIYGDPLVSNWQITQVDEQIERAALSYKYVLVQQTTLVRTAVITPDYDPDDVLVYGGDPVLYDGVQLLFDGDGDGTAFPDYTPASDDIKNHYIFIGYDPPGTPFLDGLPPYQIQ